MELQEAPPRPSQWRNGDSTDVRCSFGEPPRTLRIVLADVKDSAAKSLRASP